MAGRDNAKKKKSKIPAGVVVIAAVILIAVTVFMIRGDYESEKYTGELYFFNETATSIAAESREIKYHDGKTLGEEVVAELMRGPDNSKYQRIIEKKTKLLSVSDMETGNVLVNFSSEFLTGDNAKDVLAVYAVVKSLCAIDDINSVKVVVEGKDIYTADGGIIGYLSDRDINLSTDTYSSETRAVTLYFPQKDSQKLVKEIRTIRVTDQQPIARYIINELIKGPGHENMTEALSKDTVLLSVETSDNICFVNFKANFLDKNSGSAEKEKLAIYAIVDSLTELEQIQRVQFLMDGKKVDNFGNINIGSMFGRDESIME